MWVPGSGGAGRRKPLRERLREGGGASEGDSASNAEEPGPSPHLTGGAPPLGLPPGTGQRGDAGMASLGGRRPSLLQTLRSSGPKDARRDAKLAASHHNLSVTGTPSLVLTFT